MRVDPAGLRTPPPAAARAATRDDGQGGADPTRGVRPYWPHRPGRGAQRPTHLQQPARSWHRHAGRAPAQPRRGTVASKGVASAVPGKPTTGPQGRAGEPACTPWPALPPTSALHDRAQRVLVWAHTDWSRTGWAGRPSDVLTPARRRATGAQPYGPIDRPRPIARPDAPYPAWTPDASMSEPRATITSGESRASQQTCQRRLKLTPWRRLKLDPLRWVSRRYCWGGGRGRGL
jgi:hypothetical protein